MLCNGRTIWIGHLIEILAGTEGLAFAGEDQAPGTICSALIQHLLEAQGHLPVEAIISVGAVKPDGGDIAFPRADQGGCGY